MATKLTLQAVQRGKGPFVEVVASVVLSGNYPAGGDTVDLTSLYNQVDPNGNSLDSDLLPISAIAESQGALAGNSHTNYVLCTSTNPNNGAVFVPLTPATCKLQAYTGVTELAAGAYSNQYLSDQVVLTMVFQSQR